MLIPVMSSIDILRQVPTADSVRSVGVQGDVEQYVNAFHHWDGRLISVNQSVSAAVERRTCFRSNTGLPDPSWTRTWR